MQFFPPISVSYNSSIKANYKNMATKTTKKETTETPKKADSQAKKALQLVIDTYKVLNPEKYEAKKEALEAQLKSL